MAVSANQMERVTQEAIAVRVASEHIKDSPQFVARLEIRNKLRELGMEDEEINAFIGKINIDVSMEMLRSEVFKPCVHAFAESLYNICQAVMDEFSFQVFVDTCDSMSLSMT